MSEIYEIADAVKDALNAATFSRRIEATRIYLPVTAEAQLVANDFPTVFVWPNSDEIAVLSRDDGIEDIRIDVGIVFKFDTTVDPSKETGNSALDPLVKLAREIALSFRPGSMAGDAIWFETKYPLVFASDLLKKDRVFLAVITLKFKQAA